MITFSTIFYIFIAVFALIGALRGWGKELLVSFSIILALFIIQLIHTYAPPVSRLLASSDQRAQFFLWSIIVTMFALFGYHVPHVHKLSKDKLQTNDRVQDWLLGGVIGACNGYLLMGTIWFYLDMAGYPFPKHMSPPQEALKILSMLPPAWLGVPEIYFAVAIAFAIIVIVFI